MSRRLIFDEKMREKKFNQSHKQRTSFMNYQYFDAGFQKLSCLIEWTHMRGFFRKSFSLLLLAGLFLSMGSVCNDISAKESAQSQLATDHSSNAADFESSDTSHACHLGCCPIVSYSPSMFAFRFDTSLIKIEEIRFFETSSLPPPFKPPIA